MKILSPNPSAPVKILFKPTTVRLVHKYRSSLPEGQEEAALSHLEIYLDRQILERILEDLDSLYGPGGFKSEPQKARRAAFFLIPVSAAAENPKQELELVKQWMDSQKDFFTSKDFILMPSEYAYIHNRWGIQNLTGFKEPAVERAITQKRKPARRLYEAAAAGAEAAARQENAENAEKAAKEVMRWQIQKASEELSALQFKVPIERLEEMALARLLDSHLEAILHPSGQWGEAAIEQFKRHLEQAYHLAARRNKNIDKERQLAVNAVIPAVISALEDLLKKIDESSDQSLLSFADAGLDETQKWLELSGWDQNKKEETELKIKELKDKVQELRSQFPWGG